LKNKNKSRHIRNYIMLHGHGVMFNTPTIPEIQLSNLDDDERV